MGAWVSFDSVEDVIEHCYGYRPMTDVYNIQHGGRHYKDMAIQPMEYALANQLGYCEATAVKYISRWKKKGGITDLDKAIHFLELLKDDAKKNPSRYGLETFGVVAETVPPVL